MSYSSYRAGLWLPDEKPMYGARLIKDHPLAKGLVFSQLFNEGGGNKTFDGSGKQNHGAMTDCAWGRRGIGFNGSSSYINCGNDPSLNITKEITVEALVKFDGIPGSAKYGIVTKHNFVFHLWMDATEKIYWHHWTGVEATYAYSIAAVEPDSWYHVVGVSNANTGEEKLYLNGISQLDGNVPGAFKSSSNDVDIGRSAEYGDRYFNGTIDEVRIYNRVLSAGEIWQLYTEPYCMYEYPILEEGMLYSPPEVGSLVNGGLVNNNLTCGGVTV